MNLDIYEPIFSMDAVKLTVDYLMTAAKSLRKWVSSFDLSKSNLSRWAKSFFLNVYVYHWSLEIQQTFVFFCQIFSLVVHYFHNFHPQRSLPYRNKSVMKDWKKNLLFFVKCFFLHRSASKLWWLQIFFIEYPGA